MRPLRYSINVTLDGCCDHQAIIPDEELHRRAAETLARADALLFGRVTYQMMEDAWRPAATTGAMPDWMADWMVPFARTIDAARKYVVSSTLDRVDWNAELLRGELGEEVQRLKREPGTGVLVGGVMLPRALAELGLIDEYEFVVHPRLVGHGPALFAGLSTPVDLRLVDRVEYDSGAVAMRYVPAREHRGPNSERNCRSLQGVRMRCDRRTFLKSTAASAAAAGMPGLHLIRQQARLPNVVIIFLDDSGWGDFPPFGNPPYPAPNVRQLAADGCRFNNFYVPQAVCSASRAALLSGCYPGRTKVFGAHGPNGRGLEPSYATIGEVLKRRGYATGVFGKWHIGDQPETRPPARGFDESSGLMYSNDMWEFHPQDPEYWGRFPLQFWQNGRVTIDRVTPAHQAMLTTWYTEHAVDFIARHRRDPFFLYVPHAMPHVPLFVSERFDGKSGLGRYADVMMEIDWSVGEIVRALRDQGVERDTLVILSSDNGPWTSYGNHAGTTPFRESKGTSFDGGTRSACVMKLPGRIRAGAASTAMFSTLDLLPTIAHLTGAPLPANPVDGHNVWDLVTGAPGATNPALFYPFSTNGTFEGIITGDGRWKLHLPHQYRILVEAGNDGSAGTYRQESIERSLFDMVADPYETTNLLDREPAVARRLGELAEAHRARFYPDQLSR